MTINLAKVDHPLSTFARLQRAEWLRAQAAKARTVSFHRTVQGRVVVSKSTCSIVEVILPVY